MHHTMHALDAIGPLGTKPPYIANDWLSTSTH